MRERVVRLTSVRCACSMLMKKLGNASNELGKFYLGSQHDYVEAFRWFERGCKIFSEIEGAWLVCVLVVARRLV